MYELLTQPQVRTVYLTALFDAQAEILGRTDDRSKQLPAIKQEHGDVDGPPMSVSSRATTSDALYPARPVLADQVQTTIPDPEPTAISWPVRSTRPYL